MNLTFVFWGNYGGFPDVIKLAQRRAGCPIHIISDGVGQKIPGWVDVREFSGSLAMLGDLRKRHTRGWQCSSLCRWLVLREFARSRGLSGPLVLSDWDILWTRSLEESRDLFEKFDCMVSDAGCGSSAAYVVNNQDVLDAYSEELIRWMRTKASPWGDDFNDMCVWSDVANSGKWRVGNMWKEHGGSMFDHNIHVGEKEFVMDGPAKKVVYRNGDAFFVKCSGEEVLARSIHCWGTYKNRTSEVLRNLGIT